MSEIKSPRKEYAQYEITVTSVEKPEVLLVNLHLLDLALRGDPVWKRSELKPVRKERALATVRAGDPIFMPWLSFSEGRTRVVNGRHRLVALLDEKYTHVRIVVDPPSNIAIRTLVDLQDQEATPEPVSNSCADSASNAGASAAPARHD